MEKKEEILLNEHEEVETKTSNKVGCAIAIIATTLVLAAATTLLIGHFKFDWFKSDNYKIDANINRSVYQANYFSEKKTMTTKISLSDGHIEKKEYIIDTNFVVFLTEKKENLYSAALVLLSATATGSFGVISNAQNTAQPYGVQGSAIDFDASRVVPTGSDNRPKNVYVTYIIKY